MYKIAFFVPEPQKEVVKQAMFAVGAGRIGDYDCCSWETQGVGQFRPLQGAKPFIGELDALETVVEYKVEMVCKDELITGVLSALKSAHPYEEPAYDVIKLLDV